MPSFHHQINVHEFVNSCSDVELQQIVRAAADRMVSRGVSLDVDISDSRPADIAPDIGMRELLQILRAARCLGTPST